MISFVLCNWNSREYVWRCIESLHAQSSSEWELIVVDNASTNGSLERMRELRAELRIRELIELPENRGYAGGMNAGIARATGDLVVPLNTDVYLACNFVERVTAVARAHAAEGGVPVGLIAVPVYAWAWGEGVDELTDELTSVGVSLARRLTTSTWHPAIDAPAALFAADGSGPVITRAALQAAERQAGHVFDEGYFAYAEDTDFALRVHALGYRCVPCLDTALWHIGSASSNGGLQFSAKPHHLQAMSHRNHVRNFAKLRMPGKALRILPWKIVEDGLRLIFSPDRRRLASIFVHNYRSVLREEVPTPYPPARPVFAGGIASKSWWWRRKGKRLPPLAQHGRDELIFSGDAHDQR